MFVAQSNPHTSTLIKIKYNPETKGWVLVFILDMCTIPEHANVSW